MGSEDVKVLKERAKELECVYAVDEVLQDRSLTFPEAMLRLTEIIPTGFSCPAASRVQIICWNDSYNQPEFESAEIIYTAPIMIEDKTVGSINAGYIKALLEDEVKLLNYEAKLMDTIAHRVSQLAFKKQHELTLLLNMLRQIDPDMLLRVGEKLRVHLESIAGEKAREMFREFNPPNESSYGESNSPVPAGPSVNTEAFARKLVEGATTFLPQDVLFGLLSQWIQEQRIMAFVKTVDRKDSAISDILDAVRKYSGAVSDFDNADYSYSETETWLISELTHRFLSDDEGLINLVLDNMHIPDFEPLIEHIIGSERSAGNIGGKGAGLFIAGQILRHAAKNEPLLEDIKTPRTWYIATDQIVDFLHLNNLEELNYYKYNSAFHIRMTYDNVVKKIKNARLPPQTMNMLRVVITDLADTPLIVRSSSLLDDNHSGSFSGKYKSLFLSNQGTLSERIEALADAVLEVYSSMYNPDAIQYRHERGLINFTEQMGVLIQEVVGHRFGNYYMPLFAGVAFSNNLMRWSPRINREDGLVRLVMGLGTRAVDRINNDYPIMFAPGAPQLLVNQTPSDIRYYSPKHIDLINLDKGCFETVEASVFLKEMGKEIPQLSQLVSVYNNDFIEEKNAFSLNPASDEMVITFHHLMQFSDIPKKLKRAMDVLADKIQSPVDIEFAFDGERLYLLQCRPQGSGTVRKPAPIPQNIPLSNTLFTANKFISDGLVQGISHIVYVDPDGYSALTSREELLSVGKAVGLLNELLPRKSYILMGPGRWGSRGDIKLGVRVTYSDISNTAALIEIAKEKHSYVPELSFGTHFFQDLVESDIVYVPLYPGQEGTVFRDNYFRGGINMLDSILPQYGYLSEVIKVIDVPATNKGKNVSLHMNSKLEKAIAFLSNEKEPLEYTIEDSRRPAWHSWSLKSEQEHWQWRQYMAEQIADSMDMERFGVKGVYLFGSTSMGNTGIGSDIDLIIHVDENGNGLDELRQWLDGWSRALARINFLQTGHDTEKLLDVHIVTDQDIASGNPFAIRISSLTDPATPLRLM